MSKIINISIDLNSITESKVKQHANGCRYFNMTVKERREPDNYGNTHYVIEQQTKEEREAGETPNYLKSSGKEFTFSDNYEPKQNVISTPSAPEVEAGEVDDLPF